MPYQPPLRPSVGGPLQADRFTRGVAEGADAMEIDRIMGAAIEGQSPDMADSSGLHPGDTSAGLGLADQQAQGRRGGLRVARNAPGYGWGLQNSDFYGNISNNPMVAQTAGVGPYGRDPLFIPNQPRMAFSVVASRVQGIHEQQKELDAAVAKFKPWEDVKNPFTDPQYAASYAKLVSGSYQQKMADIEAAGIDLAEVARSPQLQEQLGLSELNRDLAAIGQGENVIQRAIEHMAAVKSGAAMADPILTKEAERILDKKGPFSGGNVRELAKAIDHFETAASVPTLWATDKVQDNVMAEIIASDPTIRRDSSGLYITTLDHTSTFENAAEAWAERRAAMYEGEGISKADLKEYALSMLGRQVKRDITVTKPNAPKSSGGGDGAKKPGTISYVASVAPMNSTEGTVYVPGETPSVQSQYVPTIDIGEVTGGKTLPLAPRLLRNDDGKEINVKIERFVKKDDGWHVTGREVLSTTTTKEGITTKEGDLNDDGSQVVTSDTNELKLGAPFDQPVSVNIGKLRTYFGNDFDPEAIWVKQQGQQKPAPSTSGPEPGSVEDGYRFKGGDPADPQNWQKL